MHVVILDSDLSYPATSGKRLRSLNLMLGQASRHRVTYIARGSGDQQANDAARAYLAAHDIEVRIVDDPLPQKSGLGFYARLAVNLAMPLPYSVASHQSVLLRQEVTTFAARNKVDLWQVEWQGYLPCLQGLGRSLGELPIVVQMHNVEALIWQRFHEAERNALKRWYIARQWRKFLAFESWLCRQVRRLVAVSEDDAALMRRWYGVTNIEVVDNGVDSAFYRGVRPMRGSRCVLYLGALDWRPNLNALDVLLSEVFPGLCRVVPDARLLIVGRNPSEKLRRRVQELPGVELHGDVPDVRPYLERSAVMAVPLRVGGGSRLKILESLAAGLPVVSSRVGAEGLAVVAGEHYAQADGVAEMIATLAECLQRPEPFSQMAEKGKRFVSQRYDWSVLSDRLDRVWRQVAEWQPQKRRTEVKGSSGREGPCTLSS